jgi:hypothetical protein
MKSDKTAVHGSRIRLPLLPAMLALAGGILLALHGSQARAQAAGASLYVNTSFSSAEMRAHPARRR